ncbi:type I secretion system permease/ATPase [Cupriavidus taiwanensis]|uniref:Cyclolysin secretion/processing ATP-binding protein CyaB n=1 Tax=Cupriavidus taiwanensis TaxID=164546 RepID=A0A7Z7JEH2_9BURK|nr:type I secretion system permease/ATPase [Cupriavidus taiwanensis]SOZ10797.1 ABC transporter, type I secretion apparatus, transmembrane component, ATP binding [Cupriavidus taiwanensis]SOZ12977.1 ABC transporter, type I secretion apparatus, transmembrane component, ATP binding [Cupriavidus taiwanensis]SOZ41475.1 ABC transporter, type I secretion apparatus, transmembrane component, ATP binding [Cupriavidus taiwanensis]SPC23850.1 ABC transporter, type I secretion apparatus, transmembrane compone
MHAAATHAREIRHAAPGPCDDARPADALLDCLLWLARHFHQPASAEALLAGLPLEGHRLTPALCARAAARAGLSARLVRRKPDEISDRVLPAMLLLDQGEACILVRRADEGMLVVVLPEFGDGEQAVRAEDLLARYTGHAIFARPAYRADAVRAGPDAVPDHAPQAWFWGVIRQCWPVYGEVLVASLLLSLFALVMPLFTMNVYDRVVPNHALETLWALAVGVGLVLLFEFAMRMLRGYFVDLAGKRIDVTVSATVFEKVLGIEMKSRPASVGSLSSQLQEFESVRDFLTSATITTLIDLPFAAVFIAAMFWVGGPLAWVPLLTVPLVLGLSLALQGPLSRAVRASSACAAQRQAALVETLVGLETIKTTGAEGVAQRQWEQVVGQMARLALRSRWLSACVINAALFAQQAATLAVVVIGVYLIADDRLTMGGLIACTILAGRALAPLSQMAGLTTRYHQARTALAGIERTMALPVERPPGKHFLHRPPLHGEIEFRAVSFRYPGRDGAALDGVSFRIASGERVGLIGRIGSGKTTIEKLILGLYQPDAGSVLVDGAEVRQLDPAALRRGIGHVPQDVMLFSGTVRDNIVIGAPWADDAAVLRAARLGGVSEFIERLPEGYDLRLGERGEGLSGGQRQAIAIARAELLQPPVLLLDEPSSAMDNRSEEQFKARLAAALAERTLLLVTHRGSLLSLVDRLIVMDQGRIVADGPKAEVLNALAGRKLHVASA